MSIFAKLRNWPWRRIIGRIAFCAAVVLTLVALYYAIERWRWRSAWEAYSAEARQRGVNLDYPSALEPNVPDELNAAKIPCFTTGLPSPAILSVLKGTEILSSRESQRRGSMTAAKESLVAVHLIEEDGLPAEQTMLKVFDREFTSGIADIKTAASRPYFQSPLENSNGIPFRGLPNVFEAYQLAAMDAEVLIVNGRPQDAADVIVAMFKLGRLLRQEPTFLSAMVEILGTQLSLQAIWNGLTSEPGWDAEKLADIEQALDQIDFIEGFNAASSGQRQYFNASLERIISDASLLDASFPTTPKWARPLWSLYPKGWLYRNLVMGNRWFDQRQELIDLSRHTLRTGESLFELTQKGKPLIDFFWVTWASNSWDLPGWFTTSELDLRQVRFACAAEQYHIGHGSYPADLDALIHSGFIKTPPRNPDDASLMEYSREGADSYKLVGRSAVLSYEPQHGRVKQEEVKTWIPAPRVSKAMKAQ